MRLIAPVLYDEVTTQYGQLLSLYAGAISTLSPPSSALSLAIRKRFHSFRRILRLRVNLPMDIDGFCWPSRGSFSWGGDGAANCEVMKNLSAKELVLDMRGFRRQLARSRFGVKANLTAALHNGVERLTTVIPDIAPAAGLKLREALGLDEHLLAGSPWLR